MLPINIKAIIDNKKETSLVCKDVDDDFIIALADYLADTKSVINSLAFIEGNLTRKGIQHLFEKYGHKLESLNVPDNGLMDEDMLDLQFPESLKFLGVRNNYLSDTTIAALRSLPLTSLDVGTQQKPAEIVENKVEVPAPVTKSGFFPSRALHQPNHALKALDTSKLHLMVADFVEFVARLSEEERLFVEQDFARNIEERLHVKCQFSKIDPQVTPW